MVKLLGDRLILTRHKARSSFKNEERKEELEACEGQGNLDILWEYAREHTLDTAKLSFVNTQS